MFNRIVNRTGLTELDKAKLKLLAAILGNQSTIMLGVAAACTDSDISKLLVKKAKENDDALAEVIRSI